MNKCKASVLKTKAGWTVRVTTPDFEFNESYTTPREAKATLEAVMIALAMREAFVNVKRAEVQS